MREVVDIVAAKNALGAQVERLQAQHNRDAAELRSLQRQLRDAQARHELTLDETMAQSLRQWHAPQ